MDKNEKLLLLQLILEDIRGNWGFDLEPRVDEALYLAQDLELPEFIKSIKEYKDDCANGYNDGRFFRMHYERGGYENLEELHGLSPTIIDKSDEFKKNIGVLTYPEYRFNDWGDWEGKYWHYTKFIWILVNNKTNEEALWIIWQKRT